LGPEKTISGMIEVEAPPELVLNTIRNIANIERLAPGIQKVVWVDPLKSAARVLVNMKIGSISFEREVDITIKPLGEGAQIDSATYGLEFQALIRVTGFAGGSRIEYTVSGKPTSFAGRIVLDALGERVIQEFSRDFQVKLTSALSGV
jgi:carbon monoxide dehydrogenase subunit G